MTDQVERSIYSLICESDGIKAREIARETGYDREVVNRLLYTSPYMRELCYRDNDFLWYGYIRQARPHAGLGDFCGYYSTVPEFLASEEDAWFRILTEGCKKVGRSLNDTRGLFHSFLDTRQTMLSLFEDLESIDTSSWEIAFELRINRSRYIRIYADVLVITEKYVFSLEFKMKDNPEEEELLQAAKYTPYLEVLFGSKYDVIPALVLTKASDLYTYMPLPGTTAEVPVCSGDMLFNLFDEYLGFLEPDPV